MANKEQPTLFDVVERKQKRKQSYKAAREGRDLALTRVEKAADDGWSERALEAVRKTACRMARFISDDVWETGLDRAREDRALGPVMMRAARLGYCVKTNTVRPSVRSHLSGKPVWESLLYPPNRETRAP